jgi:pimeloyl-ACP methyl ester carboxylesterase
MTTPIILLSGMAADGSLFAAQQQAFPQLRAPAWIDPMPEESLRDYAARFARMLDPGCPCIVGGASFGGIVALEMAQHLQARACVLISSVRSPRELPWWYRICRPMALLDPDALGLVAAGIGRFSAPSIGRGTARNLRRLSEPSSAFLRWATWAVLRWQPSVRRRLVPICQIHGDADRTFPVRLTRPDVIVQDGGHLLTVTHASVVNEFVRHVLETRR